MSIDATNPALLMIVEDDAGVARLEERALVRSGYEVRVFDSQKSALDSPELEEGDCWIIDQGLPGGHTGLLLVSELRRRGVLAPVILVTGNDDPEMLLMALRAGVGDYVRKGGEFIDLLVTRVDSLIASARAETELRLTRMRAKLNAERRRELEIEIGERRRAETQAKSALARLREMDRRKDEFLAMLGHELRNPLAPIASAVEILRGATEDPERVVWAADLIGRQVDQMRRLVDDMLDVARIMTGRLALRREIIDLRDVATQALERTMPILQRREHRVTYEKPETHILVHGDPVRLIQVVANLLDNAAKYTPRRGHIEVRIASDPDGERARIAIADDGEGIAPENLDGMFGLFVQGRRSLDRSEGGLGLGLALVRRIVGLHGGTVEAQSAGVGKGSCFTVEMPLSAEMRPAPVKSRQVAIAKGTSALVVDDNVDAAQAMAALLRLWGLRVIVAHDGDTALEAVREEDPDFVFLDIGLPGRDGNAVRAAARIFDKDRRRHWIAVTGYGQESDRERTARAGFERHLVKPVTGDELKGVLESVLSRPRN